MTFSSPSWRSLNPLKGSLNHPKKVTLNHLEGNVSLPDLGVGEIVYPHMRAMNKTLVFLNFHAAGKAFRVYDRDSYLCIYIYIYLYHYKGRRNHGQLM